MVSSLERVFGSDAVAVRQLGLGLKKEGDLLGWYLIEQGFLH